MAIDPVSAALDAVVAHIADGAIAGLTIRRGWPEANVDVDIASDKHLAALTAVGRANVELCSPKQVDVSGTAPLRTWTWRVGWVTIPLQLDLWCAYRATRDVVAPLVDARLHNKLPFRSGLYLTSTDYYGRGIACDIESFDVPGTGDEAAAGDWRRTWSLTLRTDLVVQSTMPELTEAVLQASTDLLGVIVTEPDRTIP